jgi:hypothetical protein
MTDYACASKQVKYFLKARRLGQPAAMKGLCCRSFNRFFRTLQSNWQYVFQA